MSSDQDCVSNTHYIINNQIDILSKIQSVIHRITAYVLDSIDLFDPQNHDMMLSIFNQIYEFKYLISALSLMSPTLDNTNPFLDLFYMKDIGFEYLDIFIHHKGTTNPDIKKLLKQPNRYEVRDYFEKHRIGG